MHYIFKRTLCLIHGGNGQPEQMPSRKHFSLTELKANAMKIEVHHAAAERNESHSEED